MAAYDPKRPRPGVAKDDEPAPVEALLEPAAAGRSQPADRPESAGPAEPDEVDLRSEPGPPISSNGSAAPRTTPEVPVAAPPEEGTANRAVLIAGLVGSTVLVVLLVVLRRHRRRG